MPDQACQCGAGTFTNPPSDVLAVHKGKRIWLHPECDIYRRRMEKIVTVEQSGLPMKQRPVLRLKFGQPAAPATATTKLEAPNHDVHNANIVSINPEQGGQKKIGCRVIQRTLTERFPNCFKPFGQPKLPLKIGIDKDIIAAAPDLSGHNIRGTLGIYTRTPGYHKVLVEGAARIDLNGNPAGTVTEKEAQQAAQTLGPKPLPKSEGGESIAPGGTPSTLR
jgi:hypothetical protein